MGAAGAEISQDFHGPCKSTSLPLFACPLPLCFCLSFACVGASSLSILRLKISRLCFELTGMCSCFAVSALPIRRKCGLVKNKLPNSALHSNA